MGNPPPPRAMHSTDPNAENRNAMYVPRSLSDTGDEEDDVRTRPRGTSSGEATPLGESLYNCERSKFPHGRIRSEVEESLTRMDPTVVELSTRSKSRIDSMVSLGAIASDLLRRESVDDTPKMIIVKENGTPAVQYVSGLSAVLNPTKMHFPDQQQLGNRIGRGRFGSVYMALNLSTRQTVAVKQILLKELKETEVAELMNEVNIRKHLSHPGIVRYEGMARDKETLSIVLECAASLGMTSFR